MKFILPCLAVCCFAFTGVGCKSSCSSCSSGAHSHADGEKCCGKCGKDEKKCCGKCGKDKPAE